jgi:hypothetical protein
MERDMQHARKNAFDVAAQASVEYHPTALALAEAMGRLIGCQDRCVTRDELLVEGFTEAELTAHGSAAADIARQNFVRTIAAPGPALTSRAERVQYGATVVAGLMPDIRPIHLALKGRGFNSREISDLLPDILAGAGDEFADILHEGSA